ncbi:RNA-directed DNA polymerase, eukaryota, reverse transcriptase zinc-binding domain protein [Tanacetum coccineum]
MKLMKNGLNKLSWKDGNIFERVTKLKGSLEDVQAEVDKYPHNEEIKAKSCKILSEYYEALKDENDLLMQKAKIEWLNDGDRNTAFFHKIIKGRMHKGRIVSVCNEKGERFENDQVAGQFVKHFEQFLGKKDEVIEMPKDRIIFPDKLKIEEIDMMSRDVSDVEVENAMFDIEDSKAPGPDGFTARFYKSAWCIIGKDVCHAVKEFFQKGKLLGEINATLITLVPKVPNPDKVSEFRPIACCNVLYKCISKIITNRLKGVLGNLVHESQSGRQITDNILFAQELFKGFPDKMVKWIMVYVSTVKFTININGERVGYFSGGRGLRQGDPMSLYLFTLVMEAFNLIMRKNIKDTTEFKFHHGCQKLGITHLCFADDLLVFCHGDHKSVNVIKKALEEFSSYSGLKANMGKSTVFFGGLSSTEQNNILSIVPFAIGKLPVRYLGVPLLTKKITATDYGMSINTWYDNWCSIGPIYDIVTSREIYEAGLNIDTTISELVNKYEGNWPEGWNIEYPILNQTGMIRRQDGEKDKAVWEDRNGKESIFSIRQVWKDITFDETRVDWYKIVWFVKNIPRHAFVLWMAVQNKLSTQDRIAAWKTNEKMECVFCKECLDSMEHLFFQCNYTKHVWKEAQKLLNVWLSFSWNEIIGELKRLSNNKNIWSIVRRLVFGAAMKIVGFEVKESRAVEEVEERWNIKIQKIKE